MFIFTRYECSLRSAERVNSRGERESVDISELFGREMDFHSIFDTMIPHGSLLHRALSRCDE